MYAVVEIAGLQYKVEPDQKLYVNRLAGAVGDAVSFGRVLLTADGDTICVGNPVLSGVSVSAKIVEHLKADKKIVFKKKRRKGYRKKNGHRQLLTQIEILSLCTKPKPAAQNPAVAKARSGDLKKLEGIGPKTAEVLAESGLDTFAKLAGAGVSQLKEILTRAGSHYASRNPTTWLEQARLAAAGKWDALRELQQRLRADKDK